MIVLAYVIWLEVSGNGSLEAERKNLKVAHPTKPARFYSTATGLIERIGSSGGGSRVDDLTSKSEDQTSKEKFFLSRPLSWLL